jgi:putative ABC transport system permease protein
MSLSQLILKELLHRKANFALSVVGVLVTAALFVAFLTTSAASKREIARLTRDMGFNLRIIPRDTDMDRFWAIGYAEGTLPEEAVQQLARYDKVFISFNHLVATLQQRYLLAGKEVLLTGLASALTAPQQRDRPMGYALKRGTVIVGYQVAQRLGLKKGGGLELGGRRFAVERCLAESGTDEDVRVYGALADIQQVLNLEGRINEIKAIDCLCLTADRDPLRTLRAELEKALPEAKVLQLRTLADARARQRQTVQRYAGFLSPLLLAACVVWVAVLAVLNVRERQVEIGILRSLGRGSGQVAGLFLGRAALVGFVGGVLGWALGSALALGYGPQVFQVTAGSIRPDFGLLWMIGLIAPAFTSIASLGPTAVAATTDPAQVLRQI